MNGSGVVRPEFAGLTRLAATNGRWLKLFRHLINPVALPLPETQKRQIRPLTRA